MKNHGYHCCLLFALYFYFLDIFEFFLGGLNFADNNFEIFRADYISRKKSKSAKSAKYNPCEM